MTSSKILATLDETGLTIGLFNLRRNTIVKWLWNYLKGARKELKRVKWPGRRESWKLTSGVIVFTLVVTTFTVLVDYGLDELFQELIIGGSNG